MPVNLLQSRRSLPPGIRLTLWVVLAVACAATGAATGLRTVLPGPSSQESILRIEGERLAASRGLALDDTVVLMMESPELLIEDPRFIEAREDLFKHLKSLEAEGTHNPVFSNLQTLDHTWLPSEEFRSVNEHALLVLGETTATRTDSSRDLKALPVLIDEWQKSHPGISVYYLSNGSADNEMFTLINSDLDRSLIITLPVTAVVLLWSFGSIVAAAVPLVIALVSLAASLGVAALISAVMGPVSATAAQLVVLLVLAIGVDYSLFYVSRMREEVRQGRGCLDAARAARSAVTPAVFWSGVTVALSLLGLLLMGDTVLTSMALVALGAVLVTVCGALIAAPSILELLGKRVFSGTIFAPSNRGSSFQSRAIQFSLARPWIVLLCTLTLMCALSLFCIQLRLGSTIQPQTLPQTMQSAQAYRALERAFPKLSGPDLTLVLFGDRVGDKEDEGELQPFFDDVLSRSAIHGPLKVDRSDDGTVIRYHFRLKGSSNDPQAIELVRSIREELVPKHLSPKGISCSLSGTVAYAVDEPIRYALNSPRVFGAVLLLSFLFLMLAFRSIVIPIKAVLLNLLSTTASFGCLVIIFQSEASPWNYGVIESFVPPLLFSILFGLSMDYHVFILSRIREERGAGRSPKDAVRVGIESTARTITSAALIMVAVFMTIASLQLPVMKQLGTGLAIAVLLDATIIRTLLLPASMVLLGQWNWYLPRWLEWLPKVEVHTDS